MDTARRVLPVLALAGIVTLILILLVYHGARASKTVAARNGDRGDSIAPTGQVTASSAVTRTVDQMTRDFDLRSSFSPISIPFRPTISLDQYQSLKSAAAARAAQSGGGSRTAASPAALSPALGFANFTGALEGDNGVGSIVPPDTHGAVSFSQFVETTNSSVEVFSTGGPLLSSLSHNAFVGSTDPLGDARVLYDSTWNRWVILIDDFSTCFTGTGTPSYFLAVSTGSDATGPFFVVHPSFSGFPNGACFDFPQLGMDQDAVIITGNMFGAFNPPAVAFGIAKARLYNGLGFGVPVFVGLVATLAPPIVLGAPVFDQNGADFLAAAPAGSGVTHLAIYKMVDPERPNNTSLSGPASITVPAYSVPPSAKQPGCSDTNPANLLETLDGRFQNACTQTANGHLFCVQDTGDFGVPTPRFYEIDPSNPNVVQAGDFFLSATSNDFNPSIQANQFGDAVVTWTSTDPGVGAQAMVEFGGRKGTDAPNSISVNGIPTATSASCLTGNFDPNFGLQRWGDYSAVSLDPSDPSSTTYWIVNEWVQDPTGITWASQISQLFN